MISEKKIKPGNISSSISPMHLRIEPITFDVYDFAPKWVRLNFDPSSDELLRDRVFRKLCHSIRTVFAQFAAKPRCSTLPLTVMALR